VHQGALGWVTYLRDGLRGRTGGRGGSASGFQPAMVRAHARAWVLSVMAGKIRRSSTAAASSPPWSKAARITAASSSVTTNIAGAWVRQPCSTSGGLLALAKRVPWSAPKTNAFPNDFAGSWPSLSRSFSRSFVGLRWVFLSRARHTWVVLGWSRAYGREPPCVQMLRGATMTGPTRESAMPYVALFVIVATHFDLNATLAAVVLLLLLDHRRAR
jgi:hypothetical protein